MGTLLSVAQGSAEPPKFIVLEHRGGTKGAKPVVLVGKGAISIRADLDQAQRRRDEMKYDMSGAGMCSARCAPLAS